MTSLEYLKQAIVTLENTQGRKWAEVWVEFRMDFHRKYTNGLIFSTKLGTEFFTDTKRFLENDDLLKPEKGEVLGDYDKNYNQWLIKERIKLRQPKEPS